MKTNHQRNYSANIDAPRRIPIGKRDRKLSSRVIHVQWHNDIVNGHRGEARAKRGAKKWLRVAERIDGKEIVRSEMNEHAR